MKYLFSLAAALLLSVSAQAQEAATEAAAPAPANPRVALITNQGRIVAELDAAKAPISVENFLQYVKDGHYNGTVFHRVIDGFMIQGGGYTADLQPKPTRSAIQNEAKNGLSNLRGTLAMARTGEPHTAQAQFFINVVDNSRLDFRSEESGLTWGYAVFGKVVEGMDVVDKIRALETGPQGPFGRDVPVQAVIIERAEILPADAATASEPAPAG
ncbi:MAG: peptidyl-prolyl cis-trans isomerase [Xanthomonadales bacterium]|nr:peptidyl-prolyl cis-trans isomerase [Xanthomonadales bacterium]